jgi:branched-subunit amino acid aminotransferase/4-amino-4-deoxychorismate lyase
MPTNEHSEGFAMAAAPAVEPFPWADPALKARLQADARAVAADYGVSLPENTPQHIVHDVVRIVSLLWVNGQIVPREQFKIDPSDEGLLFGRGVWESTRTVDRLPWLWPLHMDRFVKTARMLDIDLDPARVPTEGAVADYVRRVCATDVLVRLNATAGRPGKPGLVWMSLGVRPYPKKTYTLQSCPTAVRREQAFLVWKTFQYASRVRIGQLAQKAGYDSALMLDEAGNVLEAAHANIFLKLPEGWVTPSTESGLFLPGTVRQHLLRNAPVKVAERPVHRSELASATEVFVTNSNVGLVPVVRIDGHEYAVGDGTRDLRRWLQPDAATEPI